MTTRRHLPVVGRPLAGRHDPIQVPITVGHLLARQTRSPCFGCSAPPTSSGRVSPPPSRTDPPSRPTASVVGRDLDPSLAISRRQISVRPEQEPPLARCGEVDAPVLGDESTLDLRCRVRILDRHRREEHPRRRHRPCVATCDQEGTHPSCHQQRDDPSYHAPRQGTRQVPSARRFFRKLKSWAFASGQNSSVSSLYSTPKTAFPASTNGSRRPHSSY